MGIAIPIHFFPLRLTTAGPPCSFSTTDGIMELAFIITAIVLAVCLLAVAAWDIYPGR